MYALYPSIFGALEAFELVVIDILLKAALTVQFFIIRIGRFLNFKIQNL